jgi:hypothetical protein
MRQRDRRMESGSVKETPAGYCEVPTGEDETLT